MPPTILGRDIEAYNILSAGDVSGRAVQTIVEKVNRHTRPIFRVEDDAEYKTLVGSDDNDFNYDYTNAEVWKAWLPTYTDERAFAITQTVDVTLTATLSAAVDASSSDNYYVFINGGASYKGTGSSTTLAVMAGSTIPAAQRNTGFMFIAADPGNAADLVLDVDRVKITFPQQGGGTFDRWISLPIEYELAPGDFLFFDFYGNCFSAKEMTKDSFLSCFTIQPTDEARFNKGAIANELHMVRAHGRYIVNSMDTNFARGDELTHLGEKWFDVERRSGETDQLYIDRIIAAVVGEKCTPFAISKPLLQWSPYVIILEGQRGFGAYGRSFYSSMWTGTATGVYTDFVAMAFYSSIRNGLLHIRIKLQSNAQTTDSIIGAFIVELIESIILSGATYELELI